MALMWMKKAILAALKEMVLPELTVLKQGQAEMKAGLSANNQRIDDLSKRLEGMNTLLVDQSRRLDETNRRLEHDMADLKKQVAA